ncbi:MAG: DUF4230 domain-containing protein [Lachnospiraceae bacterium]|nr:DUF4230 domain-containing protein [Lachnospiraceae bacterium]
MSEGNEPMEKKGSMKRLLASQIGKYVFFAILVVVILGGLAMGLKKVISFDSKTTKIGYEDMGELATQSAYCTEVNVTDASRKLWKIEIPFTQSKYIYSYDFIIKAGFDFEQITCKEVGENKVIVTMPEVKVLSNELVDGSFKVFHEDESIFRQVTLEENNEALENMKKNAEKNAIANGLYDNAKENAEVILRGFLSGLYDLDVYTIEFQYQE